MSIQNFSLPHLHAVGSHYEIGYQIGKEFKTRIIDYLNRNDDYNQKILPFINTNYGKRVCRNFHDVIRRNFPWYIDEITGLAEGSSIPFENMLAINLRVELLHIEKTFSANKADCCILDDDGENLLQECSDFFLINKENNVMVHNEDSLFVIYDTAYLVTCKIVGGKQFDSDRVAPNEQFTAYCYPGQIPGNAYGFNSSGFAFTVDALVPKEIATKRMPRQVITRAMLACKNLLDLENLFLNCQIAYGVNVNIGYFGDDSQSIKSTLFSTKSFILDEKNHEQAKAHTFPIIFNYELGPSTSDRNRFSKHCLISNESYDHLKNNDKDFDEALYSKNSFFHFNHYERIKMDECTIHSSRNRVKRAEEILRDELNGTVNTSRELLRIASDDKNVEYPIFRNRLNSKIHPVSTVLFDLKAKLAHIYIGKPIENDKPFISLLMNH